MVGTRRARSLIFGPRATRPRQKANADSGEEMGGFQRNFRAAKGLPARQCPDLVGRCCRTAALPQQCATKSGRNRTTRWL